jgi:ATP-binding cassette subfamily A (ABC1) protein 3
MWKIVSDLTVTKGKSSVIITTHSMEEAENLSTKMGIMVHGKFRCFGPSHYIKETYGEGFEIQIKIEMLTDKQVAEKRV